MGSQSDAAEPFVPAVSSYRGVRVAAASITALRRGAVAPALLWSPRRPCDWLLDIGLWRCGDATRSATTESDRADGHGSSFEPAGVSASVTTVRWGAAHDGVDTVLAIEHDSAGLAEELGRLGDRPVRMMAWTHDEVAGHPRQAGRQWTRFTLDEVFHACTRPHGVMWRSSLVGPVVSPRVEVSDLPSRS